MHQETPARRPSREEGYSRLLLVERLETLIEEMDELGIETLDEARARLAAMHAQLDREDDD